MFADHNFHPDPLWLKDHEWRIYGDDREGIWAVVDEEDYHFFAQWRWSPKVSRGGKKIYLFRPAYAGGVNLRISLYLHVEILKRTGLIPPSEKHTIADHRNGNGLNCRRDNLRWATPSMNRRNVGGCLAHDLYEG